MIKLVVRSAADTRHTLATIAALGLLSIGFAGSSQAQSRPAGALALNQLPLSFEINRGQSDAAVKFLNRGPGYQLFLAGDEMVLSLQPPTKDRPGRGASQRLPLADEAANTSVLRARLLGAKPQPAVVGERPLPGTSNYFVGSSPKQWHRGVEHYRQVRYQQVYPGTDLVYHGDQQQLEYDFVLAPGADPDRIRMRYSGADQLSVNDAGELQIHTAAGSLIQKRPVVYQTVDGARHNIDGSFRLLANDSGIADIAFSVASYDHSQPLVIDPALVYSSYIGGGGSDQAFAIAVGSGGDIFISGTTTSTDFPLAGAIQGSAGGNSDVFVSRIKADGSALVYSTYLGGSSTDAGLGIAVDGSGSAYVTGYTRSSGFPTRNAIQTTIGGDYDAFVTKLSPDGASLVYSTYWGGNNPDQGYAIAVDVNGNAYVTGATQSANFPLVNPIQKQMGNVPDAWGTSDVFVSEIAADGSSAIYSTYLGGEFIDVGAGIAVDASGKAYVTGSTDSSDYPLKNALQTSVAGQRDAFISVVKTKGSGLVFSTYLGGSNYEWGRGIGVDATGNIYIGGYTSSDDFPMINAWQPQYGGGSDDAYVAKLSANGAQLLYSTYIGGSDDDSAYAMQVDPDGSIYLAGYTASIDFPLFNAVQSVFGGGYEDAFLTKLSADGSAPDYSTYLGGAGMDEALALAVDGNGFAYLCGLTYSSNFPRVAALQAHIASTNDPDAFVSKIDGNATGNDTTPKAFSFTDQSNVPLKTKVVSDKLKFKNFDAPLPVSVSGGQYRVNGGDWLSTPTVISESDQLQLKVKSSSQPGTAVVVRLTAGSVTDEWVVSTAP
jgi:hypothetical protein